MEFHRFDHLEDTAAVQTVAEGTQFYKITTLDPGMEPNPAFSNVGDEGPTTAGAAPASDAKSQDKAAREGDTRKKRAKRKKGKNRRRKKTAAAKRKKKKKGKKPDTSVGERNLGELGATLSSALRLPDGATGLAYYNSPDENIIMYLFSSAAEPYSRHVLWSGQDLEDSVHLMNLPALATVPPAIHENKVFVQFLYR